MMLTYSAAALEGAGTGACAQSCLYYETQCYGMRFFNATIVEPYTRSLSRQGLVVASALVSVTETFVRVLDVHKNELGLARLLWILIRVPSH